MLTGKRHYPPPTLPVREGGRGRESSCGGGGTARSAHGVAVAAAAAARSAARVAVGIAVGVLHVALVVGGDVLHHLSVAVIAGDLYGHAAELVLLYPRHTVVRIGVIRHDEVVCRKNNPGFGQSFKVAVANGGTFQFLSSGFAHGKETVFGLQPQITSSEKVRSYAFVG